MSPEERTQIKLLLIFLLIALPLVFAISGVVWKHL